MHGVVMKCNQSLGVVLSAGDE